MNITAPVVLLLLAVFAIAAIIVGVGLLGGLAWALITGGVFGLVAVVLLYDPKPGKRR